MKLKKLLLKMDLLSNRKIKNKQKKSPPERAFFIYLKDS